MGVCGLLMRNYESTVAPMVLAVVPGLGVLMMVFYLYPKEFFACGIVGGLGLLGLWVYRTLSSGTIYYAYLILTVVIAAAGAVLAWKLKKAGGGVEGQEPQLDPAAVGCSLPAVLPYSSHYPGSAPASSGCGVPWATMAFGQWQLGCSSWRSTSRQNSCKSKESRLLTPLSWGALPFHLCQSVGRQPCSTWISTGFPRKWLLTQGEKGGEVPRSNGYCPPEWWTPGLLPRQNREKIPGLPGRQGEVTIGQGGKYRSHHRDSLRPCLGQVAQVLQVGQGVVQPAACAAVEVDGGASLGQGGILRPAWYRCHPFLPERFARGGLGGRFQGVQVSQQEIWAQPGGLAVAVPPVGGQDKVPG